MLRSTDMQIKMRELRSILFQPIPQVVIYYMPSCIHNNTPTNKYNIRKERKERKERRNRHFIQPHQHQHTHSILAPKFCVRIKIE